ncbi:MAG: T9SS type A sorting domain-containing protein [Bacteroidales bacterium]|nr:T9SS type A sorting domain-containing protein [Bacteroidales bacterium]
MNKKILIFLPLAMLFLSLVKGPVVVAPWNEEKTDSLGPVVTAFSLGGVHSTFHYDLTKLLAIKMGLSPDTAEILARYCALVDQINPKSGYPYVNSLNSVSIPDTFPDWNESIAGTERGSFYPTNAQKELTAQYWHFPFRDPADTLTGKMVYGTYPAPTNYSTFTGPPYFWRVPITYNLKNVKNWALYNGGNPGLPDLLTPVEVMYADANSSGYQIIQPNSIQAFALFIHSLGDAYSHEECMVSDTIRGHPSSNAYCGLTYHSEHEFAYDVSIRAKPHADSCMRAIWRAIREYKRINNISTPALWMTDNNGFQDGDGIPDQLEDDGDTDYTESFLERWKNPAVSDLNGDGVINHSDHTTWRIQVCNVEIGLPSQPGTISGPSTVCVNESATYSISAVTGATSYSWTLPQGWSGSSGTTSIIVMAGVNGGNIKVTANNFYGPGPVQSKSIAVADVLSQPGSISGPATVCQNATITYSISAVPDATSYTWTLPAGWSGSSSSTSITATAGANSGDIMVTANNSCGPSLAQTLGLSVISVPNQNSLSGIVLSGQTKCYNATQTITVAGNSTNFWVRTDGSATMVAGQNIIYLPGTRVFSGGYMYGYITTSGVCCGVAASAPGSFASKSELIDTEKLSISSPETTLFKVYPNPTSGKFVVELNGDIESPAINIEVFGIQGDKVLSGVLTGERMGEFSLSGNPSGIYFVRIMASGKTGTIKLLKLD